MEYKSLLTEWGLGDFIPAFENECVTDESFELLDDATINIILIKSGPRLLFKKKFFEHLNAAKPAALETSLLPKQSFYNSEGASTSTSTVSDFIYEPDTDLQNIINQALYSDDDLEPDESTSIVPPPTKLAKISSGTYFRDSLEDILKKTVEGQILLRNRRKLKNDHRQKLVRIVVSELLLSSRKSINRFEKKLEIKTEDFIRTANDIAALFPGEAADTYYCPYTAAKEGLRKVPARGKLWAKFNNIKAAVKLANKNKILTSKEATENIDPNISHQLNSLKSLCSKTDIVYSEVVEHWELTFQLRKITYGSTDVEQIYNDFPILNHHEYGIALLECDFNQQYPDKIDIIYETWPKVSKAILAECEDRRITSCGYNLEG
ncbi:uncharacterized protein LOC116164805 isoform X2 [Photinus pyralis]|nr:uncharacterized protein LOC116164805 isoform X2 [Photinus pyralis]